MASWHPDTALEVTPASSPGERPARLSLADVTSSAVPADPCGLPQQPVDPTAEGTNGVLSRASHRRAIGPSNVAALTDTNV